MYYVYPCVLNPEEGGDFYVTFPDVRFANSLEATEHGGAVILLADYEQEQS